MVLKGKLNIGNILTPKLNFTPCDSTGGLTRAGSNERFRSLSFFQANSLFIFFSRKRERANSPSGTQHRIIQSDPARVNHQTYSHSIITPTPVAPTDSIRQLAISRVNLSWTWSRLEKCSAKKFWSKVRSKSLIQKLTKFVPMRAIFERPIILPLGR